MLTSRVIDAEGWPGVDAVSGKLNIEHVPRCHEVWGQCGTAVGPKFCGRTVDAVFECDVVCGTITTVFNLSQMKAA